MTEAWMWHRSALRVSRHVGMHGLFLDRMVGMSLYSLCVRPIRSWATDERVGADLLREALADVNAIYSMTAPMSHALQAEYFYCMRALEGSPDELLSPLEETARSLKEAGGCL